MMEAYPDLVLSTPEEIAAFVAVNPDIALMDGPNGSKIVSGIDRVDLWVGGLAEKHVMDGIVGQTFWVVLHEQFDRLQEGDRFYYLDRFDNFDFYETFVDGQDFSDIVARNTGLTGLPEDIFVADLDDDEDRDDDDDHDNDEDDDDVDTGTDDDGDDDGTGTGTDDDGDDDGTGTDDGGDGDGTTNPPPASSGETGRLGTTGADLLVGEAGADVLSGLEGDDLILGQAGDDTLLGGDGNDLVKGGDGKDVIFGGAGADDLFGDGGDDMIFGDGGDDRIFAGEGNDVAEGGAGSDTVYLGAGDDRVIAKMNDGDDVYWGEAGVDTLDLAAIIGGLSVDLGSGVMQHGSVASAASGTDTIFGFENVVAGSGDDTIIASNVVNVMDGGGGNDTFVFNSAAAANGDTIVGFQPGDTIDLSGIDANTGEAGDQSFSLVSGGFTAIGQVMVTHETRDDGEYTVVTAHLSDDSADDFSIALTGRHNLTASDFNGVS
ncbi:peroxidase family protein [Fulvimarina pelagi]